MILIAQYSYFFYALHQLDKHHKQIEISMIYNQNFLFFMLKHMLIQHFQIIKIIHKLNLYNLYISIYILLKNHFIQFNLKIFIKIIFNLQMNKLFLLNLILYCYRTAKQWKISQDYIDFSNQIQLLVAEKKDQKKISKFFKINTQAYCNQLDKYFQQQCNVYSIYIRLKMVTPLQIIQEKPLKIIKSSLESIIKYS